MCNDYYWILEAKLPMVTAILLIFTYLVSEIQNFLRKEAVEVFDKCVIKNWHNFRKQRASKIKVYPKMSITKNYVERRYQNYLKHLVQYIANYQTLCKLLSLCVFCWWWCDKEKKPPQKNFATSRLAEDALQIRFSNKLKKKQV